MLKLQEEILVSWNLGQLSTWLCDKMLVCSSRPGFRAHAVERCTLYVWMPSTCSLGDLKLIHVSVKDPRRTLRSRGESSYVQPQRNTEVKTINYVGMPSNPWRDLRIGCVKAFSQSILVRALIKFLFGLVWFYQGRPSLILAVLYLELVWALYSCLSNVLGKALKDLSDKSYHLPQVLIKMLAS